MPPTHLCGGFDSILFFQLGSDGKKGENVIQI
jgi:hypothetical protein